MKTTDKNIPITSEIGIQLLHEPYKTIATLRIIDKLPYKEIAKRINMSEGECRLFVFRAKKKLKKLDNMLLHHNENEISLEDLIKKWFNTQIDGRYV